MAIPIILFVSISFLYLILYEIFEDYAFRFWAWDTWMVIGIVALNWLPVASLFKKIRTFVNQLSDGNEVNKVNITAKHAFTFDISLSVAVLFFMLSLYANFVFPKISPVYAGGKKQKMEFIVKPDRIDSINSIGLKAGTDNRLIGPVDVIFESADYFLIAPPFEFSNKKVKAIRINKDLISGSLFF